MAKMDATSKRMVQALAAHICDRDSRIAEETFLQTVFDQFAVTCQNIGAKLKDDVMHDNVPMSMEPVLGGDLDDAADALSRRLGWMPNCR